MTSATSPRRSASPGASSSPRSALLSKVPEITAWFWIIKVLATTIGETAADYLDVNLGFGLDGTTVVMTLLLAVALARQVTLPRYVPGAYWTVVVLVSVVGTLITDNLTDHLGVSLVVSTVAFAVALAVAFAAWAAIEGTLSIHSIRTRRREGLYWLAILLTFALGTAVGDLLAERLAIGYLPSALIFAGVIAIVAVAHLRFGLDAVLAFWIAYVVTRPLGASLGDYLAQAPSDGGLGLGTTGTSALFLVAILTAVTYLTASRRDQPEATA